MTSSPPTAAEALAPYDALAAVYDRWTSDNDYPGWADRLALLFTADRPVATVLDLCCGTGTITRLLQDRGFEVTGVDGSSAMLDRARERVVAGTALHEVRLPAPLPLPAASFDAAVCCFDSVNYLAPDQLAALLREVATVLRPGGRFVFDLNTRHKLEHVFGNSHYGDDLDDFAYVWRNRYDPERHRCDFAISLFTADGAGFRRQTERHGQWWFGHDEIRAAARAAGFAVVSVTEDYSDRPVTPESLRETWLLVRSDAPDATVVRHGPGPGTPSPVPYGPSRPASPVHTSHPEGTP
ncbi:methyltransferase family protein [Streptomyces sp. TLI_235]|nr:class I SAM-dependent methyltransferase [Streptomyces sp. TLI_235]PBC66221.1 methyltransferase family protein [Streptomyces sp. TLI_235]